MNCKKCGAELPEGAAFCFVCGKKQTRDSRAGKKRRPNGAGTVYKEGTTWTAEITKGYTLKNGKKHRVKVRKRGFKLEREALDWCHDARRNVKRPALTLEELWEAWSTSDMTQLSDSKQSAYTIAHNRLLKTDIAFVPPCDLRLSDLQEAMDKVCSTYYTARDFKNLLSKLFQRAMADKDCTVNLARMLTLPTLEEEEAIPFNDVEQAKIWKAYSEGDMICGYMLVMIYTGMMPGELLACKKDMILWDQWRIEGAGKKTKKRRETPIVFPDIIEPVLRQLCEYSTGKKLLTMNKDNFYEQYHETLQRIGCRDLPPYSCRHTTGTALAKENLSPTLIQKIMRHAKFSSTQRYIHQDTDDMRSGVNALPKPKEA